MRQAFIVKNPKWEPFTAVSDAFKKLDGKENAVLLVRGRAKEKGKVNKLKEGHGKQKPETAEALAADLRKSGAKAEEIEKAVKAFKPIKAAVAMLCLFFALFTVNAQQNITAKLYTTVIGTTNSNSGAATGWNPGDIITLQGWITTTNTATNSLVFKLDETLGGSHWSENTKTLEFFCTSHTNGTLTLMRITNNLGTLYWKISSAYRVGSVTDTNAATVAELLMHK